jgi:gluconokinase
MFTERDGATISFIPIPEDRSFARFRDQAAKRWGADMVMQGGTTRYLLVMGVSGSGKSTIAARLGATLGWAFVDGDDLQPAPNIEKMRRGIALDDADRAPWLAAVADVIAAWRQDGVPGVVACSALRKTYRAAIGGGAADVRFVYLRITPEVAARRVAQRRDHFMPPSLVDSQFRTLEEPGDDEAVMVVDAALEPAALIGQIVAML